MEKMMQVKEKGLVSTLIIALIVIGLFSFHLIRLGEAHQKEKQKVHELQEQVHQLSFECRTKDETIQKLETEIQKISHIREELITELSISAAKLGWASRGYNHMTLPKLIKQIQKTRSK